MNGSRRTSFTFGSLMVLLGAWFLAVQFVPQLSTFVTDFFDWPWFVIGVGVIFFASALLSGVAGLAVPGFIIMGIGGILYYTNSTNDWEAWAYLWPFILVSIGTGVLVMNILEGKLRRGLRDGGNTIITGLVFFVIFASFMRPIFGEDPLFGEYWPVTLIVFGSWLLVRALIPRGKKKKKKVTVITEDTIPPQDEEVGAVVEVVIESDAPADEDESAEVDEADEADEEDEAAE